MDTKMIGNKIAQARKSKSISQAQLAEQLFISPQAVGKWERGESVPDIITVNRIAQLLGVTLNYFSDSFSVNEEKALNLVNDATQVERQHTLPAAEPPDLMKFNGSNLPESDFADVIAHKRKFIGSALRGSNFSGANLTGSSFRASDVREAIFDHANLTDCLFSALDLTDASFNKSILTRTEFSKSALAGAKFIDAKLLDTKLTKTDLRNTVFENCVFEGVEFKYADLSGLSFDGQTFTGVRFHNTAMNNVTFNNAILRNVSFRAAYALTNKYYRALKTISFAGAKMDKLTYAALQGVGVDLPKVTLI